MSLASCMVICYKQSHISVMTFCFQVQSEFLLMCPNGIEKIETNWKAYTPGILRYSGQEEMTSLDDLKTLRVLDKYSDLQPELVGRLREPSLSMR